MLCALILSFPVHTGDRAEVQFGGMVQKYSPRNCPGCSAGAQRQSRPDVSYLSITFDCFLLMTKHLIPLLINSNCSLEHVSTRILFHFRLFTSFFSRSVLTILTDQLPLLNCPKITSAHSRLGVICFLARKKSFQRLSIRP